MPSNVIQLSAGIRCRVLIGHQRSSTRRRLRALIGAEGMAVVEVAEGESALAELATARFDLLILELDLPVYDGVMVMNMHRVLLSNQAIRSEPPAVILMLAPEVRGNSILPDHLNALGVDGVIDEEPGNEVAGLVHAILKARACRAAAGKPAAA